MLKTKTNERYDAIRLLFLCFMTVYVAVREVPPLHWLIGSQVVSAAIFLLGFGLILAGLFFPGSVFSDRRTDLLALFIVVTILSCVLNFKYGYADNVKAVGAMILFFMLFFGAGIGKTPAQRKREINWITGTLCAVWAVFTLASVLMFTTSIFYKIDTGNWVATDQGFSTQLNRLSGVFNDANYAGYISNIVILSSVRFFRGTKKNGIKALHVLNILLQFAYMTLGGSYSALIILVASACVFAFYLICSLKGGKTVFSYAKNAAAAVLCGALCYGMILGGQYLLPYARTLTGLLPESIPAGITEVYNAIYEHGDFEIKKTKNAYGKNGVKEAEDFGPIKRKDTAEAKGEDDISHGRFDRWEQSLRIFSSTPVLGTSPRNVSAYAKVHFPDTLMAKYKMAPHNGYLDILVGTGAVGMVVFLLFFIPAVIALLKKYFRFENDGEFILAASSVFILAASALFVSDLFFMISIGAFFFWTFFGYALHTEEGTEKRGLLMKLYEAVFRRKEKTA